MEGVNKRSAASFLQHRRLCRKGRPDVTAKLIFQQLRKGSETVLLLCASSSVRAFKCWHKLTLKLTEKQRFHYQHYQTTSTKKTKTRSNQYLTKVQTFEPFRHWFLRWMRHHRSQFEWMLPSIWWNRKKHTYPGQIREPECGLILFLVNAEGTANTHSSDVTGNWQRARGRPSARHPSNMPKNHNILLACHCRLLTLLKQWVDGEMTRSGLFLVC